MHIHAEMTNKYPQPQVSLLSPTHSLMGLHQVPRETKQKLEAGQEG